MAENETAIDLVLGEKVLPEKQADQAVTDQAALRRLESETETAVKLTAKAVQNVFDKVFEAKQIALFNEPEFEQAMLVEGETLRKKYTAEQAEKIEWRRDACLYMLARECPKEDIAKILRMNFRTVEAIAAQNGRKAAGFTEHFAGQLLADAASDIALAHTKRDTASYKDLHIGAGIKMQHATALKLVAEVGERPAIDVDAGNDKLKGLRDKLKQLAPAPGGAATIEAEVVELPQENAEGAKK